MERRLSTEIWAALSLLVVCLLVGFVELGSVRRAASTGYLVGWLVTYLCFLLVLGRAAAARLDAQAEGEQAWREVLAVAPQRHPASSGWWHPLSWRARCWRCCPPIPAG